MNANVDKRTIMRIWMNIERITSSKLDSREEKRWESMRFKGDSTVSGFLVWSMELTAFQCVHVVLLLITWKSTYVQLSTCPIIQPFLFFWLFFYLLRKTILLFNVNFILKLLYHQTHGNMHSYNDIFWCGY